MQQAIHARKHMLEIIENDQEVEEPNPKKVSSSQRLC